MYKRQQEIRHDAERPDAFALTEVHAEIVAVDGSEIFVTAGMGIMDPRTKTAEMTGLARLTSSSGYVMETEGLIADFDTGVLTSVGPLDVEAPFGTLSAGGLEVRMQPDGGGQRMVFNQGVRLLYLPQP